jgi:hypothetical protein
MVLSTLELDRLCTEIAYLGLEVVTACVQLSKLLFPLLHTPGTLLSHTFQLLRLLTQSMQLCLHLAKLKAEKIIVLLHVSMTRLELFGDRDPVSHPGNFSVGVFFDLLNLTAQPPGRFHCFGPPMCFDLGL